MIIMTIISDWAETVIERDKKCVICGTRQNLEAHHVFKVNPYDEQYLDINNGITLCTRCHEEYHKKYGVICNIENLLKLKKDFITPDYNKLNKKYVAVKSQQVYSDKKIKKLKERNRKLRKKNRLLNDMILNPKEKIK